MSSDAQAARAELQKYTAAPGFTPPNAPFKIGSLKGKTIAIVAVDETTPALEFAAQGVEQAAKVAGLETTVFDAKDTPSLMTEGVDQAISQKSAAIELVGIPIALIPNQLKAATQAGIPVVNIENNEPSTTAPGQGAGPDIYATASEDMTLEAKLAAYGAIVQTNGNVHALIMNTPGITPAPPLVAGFKQVLSQCGGCSVVDITATQLQDWSTGVGPQVTSSLDAHPDVNVVLPIFSTMALFAVPAIQQSGKGDDVTVNTTSANQPTFRLMETAGNVLTGVSGHNDYWVGWLAVNQAMRGMLKLAPGNPVVPPRWVTPETVKKEGTSEPQIFGSAYINGFKKLWGLG